MLNHIQSLKTTLFLLYTLKPSLPTISGHQTIAGHRTIAGNRASSRPPHHKLEHETSQSSIEPEYETTPSSNTLVSTGVNDDQHVTRLNNEIGNPSTLSPTEDGSTDIQELTKSKGRSLSKQWQDWGNGRKILDWNERCQPLGKKAAKLATQLGYYARQGNLFPLNVKSWNKMVTTRLDDVWEIVKANTNAPNDYKNICLEKIGVAWKRHKSNMKQKYYISKKTEEEQLANVPPTVEPSQWKDLVREWSTEESKAIAERNTKNREKLCAYPRTGRTSFSIIVEEMKEKDLQVDQLGIFCYTRQKNNRYCEDDGAADLEEIENARTILGHSFSKNVGRMHLNNHHFPKMSGLKQKLDALPIDKQSDEEERTKIFREVVGQGGHGRSLCMGTCIRTSKKRAKVSHDKEVEEEVVVLNEKIDEQKDLIKNQQKHHEEQLENIEKRHQEQMENLDKRYQELMKNQDKRHRQEMAKIYKVVHNVGLVNDVSDAVDNNQDTSNQF